MCRELLEEPVEAADEAVMGACFGEYVEPLGESQHPAPLPGSPGSPTSGCCLGCCHAHCCLHGEEEEEEEAAAAEAGVTGSWEPWQSFV